MQIPFAKAHGAKNDFLLTWADEAPAQHLAAVAVAICERNTGIGADGWLVCDRPADGMRIRLFNPDGGEVEMSGNGTRCAAAWAMANGYEPEAIRIRTGGGEKQLRRLRREGPRFVFEMNMGRPVIEAAREALAVGAEIVNCTILNVGNPQCAVFVEDFDFDWAAMGAMIERDPRFPHRTNVSFVKHVDGLTLDVRFFERGVGVTNSSGTGSTGAAGAAIVRGIVGREVTVQTPAGPLEFRWPSDDNDVLMVGPAELIGTGFFYFQDGYDATRETR
jgi:diaminopimelate epimerase